MLNLNTDLFEFYEQRKPEILWLNEKKFNNLIALCKDNEIGVRLISKEVKDLETFYEVEIKDPIALIEIALDKSKAYEEKLKHFAELKEEHLFI